MSTRGLLRTELRVSIARLFAKLCMVLGFRGSEPGLALLDLLPDSVPRKLDGRSFCSALRLGDVENGLLNCVAHRDEDVGCERLWRRVVANRRLVVVRLMACVLRRVAGRWSIDRKSVV